MLLSSVILYVFSIPIALAEDVAPPSPIPSLNRVLRLPANVSAEMSYVAEPIISLRDPSVFNYAHGVEVMLQMSPGFSHKDVSTWKEYDHWIFTFDLQQYFDTGDFGTEIGVSNPPQEIYNPQGLYLGELSFTRNPGDGWLYMRLGALSIDADFLSPEVTGLYTHAAFNNQYNVSMEIFPISPMNAFGAVVGAKMEKAMMLKGGLYQLSKTQTDFDKRGWDWTTSGTDGVLGFVQLEGVIGEVEETLDICPPDDHTFSRHSSNCDGTDHVINELPSGGWQIGAFAGQTELNFSSPQIDHQTIYGNVTLPVSLEIGAGHRFWMSAAYELMPENNPLPLWVGSGWISQGLFNSRPLDLVLLGFSWSQFSFDDMSQRELLLELEYSTVLTDTIILQPNIQWFVDSAVETQSPLTLGVGIHFGM